MVDRSRELNIDGTINLNLDEAQFEKQLKSLIAKINSQIQDEGRIDLSKMVTGISKIRGQIKDILNPIGEDGKAGERVVDEALSDFDRALRQIERKSEALRNLRISKPDRKLLSDLADPTSGVTFDSLDAKKKTRAYAAVATGTQIAAITREIANVMARQPELKGVGLATTAAIKPLADSVRGAAKAIDLTVQGTLKESQRKQSLAQRREAIRQSEVSRAARGADLSTSTGQALVKTAVQQKLAGAIGNLATLEEDGRGDTRQAATLRRHISNLTDYLNAMQPALQRYKELERARADIDKRRTKLEEKVLDNQSKAASEASANQTRTAAQIAEEDRKALKDRKSNYRAVQRELAAEQEAERRIAAQKERGFETLAAAQTPDPKTLEKGLETVQKSNEKKALQVERERQKSLDETERALQANEIQAARVERERKAGIEKDAKRLQERAEFLRKEQAFLKVQREKTQPGADPTLSAYEKKVVGDYYAAKAARDEALYAKSQARVTAGAGDPRLAARLKANSEESNRMLELFNKAKYDEVEQIRADSRRRQDLRRVESTLGRAGKVTGTVDQLGAVSALVAQMRTGLSNAEVLSTLGDKKGAAAIQDEVIQTEKELRRLVAALSTGTKAIQRVFDDATYQALKERVAKQGDLSPGLLTASQLKDRRDLLGEEIARAVAEKDSLAERGLGTDSAEVRQAAQRVAAADQALRDLNAQREKEVQILKDQKTSLPDLTKQHEGLTKQLENQIALRERLQQVAAPTLKRQGLDPLDPDAGTKADFSTLNAREQNEVKAILKARLKQIDIEERIEKSLARQNALLKGGSGGGGVVPPGGGGGGGDGPEDPERAKRYNELAAAKQKNVEALQRLNVAYDQIHTPLSQVTRLFNQFFRFAIGYGALYQVIYFFQALTREVVQLNKALYSIQAVTGATDQEIAGLGNTIKSVASEGKFSLIEMAEAAQTLGQAGVEIADLPGVLKEVSKFATAAATSLETAADLITTFRNVYKDTDERTIANQLTRAVNISKLTAEDLKTIFSLSAQTAESFNLTSEQYLSAVTVLRNAGIKTSTTATGLRQAMLELFNADQKTLEAFEKRYKDIGEKLTPSEIRSRFFSFSQGDNPLVEAIGELKRLGFGAESQKSLQRVFDIRAVNAIQALVSNFQELETASSKITFGDAAAEAADIQMRSLSNSMSHLFTTMSVFTANLTEGPIDSLETLADKAAAAVNELNQLDATFKLAGESGIRGAALEGAGGALAGAVAGSRIGAIGGIGGAAVGGIAGGIAGVGANISKQNAAAKGETPIVGPLLEAAGIAVLIFAFVRQLKGLAGIAEAASNMKAAVKGIKLFGPALSLFAAGFKAIPWVRIVSLIATLGVTLYEIAEVTGLLDLIPGRKLDKAREKAKAARLTLEENQRKRDAFLQQADNYQVDDDVPDGSPAAGVKRLQTVSAEYKVKFEALFGQLEDGAKAQLETLLESLNGLTFRSRKGVYENEIQGLSAQLAGVTFKEADYQISQLLQLKTEAEKGATNYIADMRKSIEQANLVLLSDAAKDSEEYLRAKVKVDALKNLISSDPRVGEIVLNHAQATADELINIAALLGNEFARLFALQAAGVNASDYVSAEVIADTAVEAVVQQFQAEAGKDGKIDSAKLTLALNALIQGQDALTEASRSYIQSIVDAIARYEEKLRNPERLPATTLAPQGRPYGPPVVLPERDAPPTPGLDAISLAFQGTAAAGAAQIEQGKRKVEENLESKRREAAAQLEKIAELLEEPAFPQALEEADDEAAVALRKLVNAPEGLQTAIRNLVNSLITLGDDGIIAYAQDLSRIIERLDGLESTTEGDKDRREAEAEKAFLNGQKEAKQAQLALDARIKRISRATRGYLSKEYELLANDGVENLYRQRAEQQKILLGMERTKLAKETEALEKKVKADDDYGRKHFKQVIENQSQLNELDAKIAEIDDATTQEIIAAKENAFRNLLKRREDQLQKTKKQAETQISEAALGEGSSSVFDAIIEIDAANKALLDTYLQQLESLGTDVKGLTPEEDFGKEILTEEMAARQEELRALLSNVEELERLASLIAQGTDAYAQALQQAPASTGNLQTDAKIARAGGVLPDEARLQKLARDAEAKQLEIAGARDRLDFANAAAANNQLGPDKDQSRYRLLKDQVEATNRLNELETQLIEIRLEEAQVTAGFRSELDEAFDLEVLASKIRAMDSSMEHLGETLQDNFVSGLDSLGDWLAEAATGADNLKESLQDLVHEWAKDQVSAIIKAQLGNLAQYVLNKFGKKDEEGTKTAGIPTTLPPAAQQAAAAGEQVKAAQDQTLAGQDQRIAADTMKQAAQQVQTAAQMFQTCPCPGEGGGVDLPLPDFGGATPKGVVTIDDSVDGGVPGPTATVSTPPFLDPALVKPDIQIPASDGIGQIGDNSADRLPTTSAGTDPASPVSGIVEGFRTVMAEIGFGDLFAGLGKGIQGLGSGLAGLFKSFIGLFSGGGQAGVSNKQQGAALVSQLGGAIGGVWGAVLQGGAAIYSASQEDNAATGGINMGGKIVRGYRRGGMLKGPGSGTSDSLRGVMLDGKGKASPIAVSNKEAVLTARAVDLLGESFIHDVNAGRLSAYDSRPYIERSHRNTRSAVPAPSFTAASVAASPKVELTMVNAVDSPSVLESALNTPVGGEKMINFFRMNKSRINSTLGRR